jgi:hypothetical protein
MHMLKKRNDDMSLQVQIGDIIRSYDFKPMIGRGDCYVEGAVSEVNNTENYFQAYKIVVTKDVFDGEDRSIGKGSRVGEFVFVPYRVDFMEYQGRVINLSR